MHELLCRNMAGIELKKKRLAVMAVSFLLLFTGYFLLLQPVKAVAAQKVSNMKQMEKVFEKSIKDGKDTVIFSSSNGYTTTQIQNELQNAAKSQNRLLSGSIQIKRQIDSSGKYEYKITLSDDALIIIKMLQSRSAAVKAAASAVKKCIRSGMTDKQKAKAIHNYIVKNCRYLRTQDAFTAYGALVDGSAVCQRYAAAFNLMAGKCGLQSMTVCGTTLGGVHAWTYVKIGSKYRYIDCTWDDFFFLARQLGWVLHINKYMKQYGVGNMLMRKGILCRIFVI